MRIIKASSHEDLSKKAANIIASVILSKEYPLLGLATGSSPIGTYKELIDLNKKGVIDFSNVRTVNLDEYIGLQKDHDQSYDYFMRDNLFNHVNIDLKNTNIPSGMASDPKEECIRYEKLIEDMGGVDIQLLGLGVNGHIGFNEPNSVFANCTHVEDLSESTIEANKRFFEKKEDVPTKAITMGVGTIMKARKILLICSGEAKKEAFLKLSQQDVDPSCPASILQYHPDVTIIYADFEV